MQPILHGTRSTVLLGVGVVVLAVALVAVSCINSEKDASTSPAMPTQPMVDAGKADPKLVTRPAGTRLLQASHAELVKEGEQLWNDRSLSTNGLACGICHLNNGNFNASFTQPYPHRVAMPAQMAGRTKVALDEMVQFCLVQPMASTPLPWEARPLAALTAYSQEVQKNFIKVVAANPCLLKPKASNPCNPYTAKNPCDMKR
jgi:cytochrome c